LEEKRHRKHVIEANSWQRDTVVAVAVVAVFVVVVVDEKVVGSHPDDVVDPVGAAVVVKTVVDVDVVVGESGVAAHLGETKAAYHPRVSVERKTTSPFFRSFGNKIGWLVGWEGWVIKSNDWGSVSINQSSNQKMYKSLHW